MRKLLAVASLTAAAVASAVGPAPVGGQSQEYTVHSELEMLPKQAGTKDRPSGIELHGRLRFSATPGFELPVITAGRVLLPRGIAYNGHRYPKCSGAVIRARPKECPRRSVMGMNSRPFVETTVPKVVFYNGGAERIWAYTTHFHPAFVQEPLALDLERLQDPRWGYELSFQVPPGLQVILGAPIGIPSFLFRIGGKQHAPLYLTTNGGCPKRGFRPYEVSLDYRFHPDGPAGTSIDRGRLVCN